MEGMGREDGGALLVHLFGSVESCHVVHSFVPPHCVPSRQLSFATGFMEPLIDLEA